MAKCSGCSGGLVSVSTSDTNCIHLTGDGTALVPLVATLQIDPASPAAITCGVDGLSVAGGGGVPDEHIYISGDGGATIDSFVPYILPLDPAANGGVAYTLRGTNITWSGANPTRVTINSTGIYDVTSGVTLITVGGKTPPFAGLLNVILNGALDVKAAIIAPRDIIGSDQSAFSLDTTYNGWALTAGDYLEMEIDGQDFIGDTDVLLVLYGAITVTQRI